MPQQEASSAHHGQVVIQMKHHESQHLRTNGQNLVQVLLHLKLHDNLWLWKCGGPAAPVATISFRDSSQAPQKKMPLLHHQLPLQTLTQQVCWRAPKKKPWQHHLAVPGGHCATSAQRNTIVQAQVATTANAACNGLLLWTLHLEWNQRF